MKKRILCWVLAVLVTVGTGCAFVGEEGGGASTTVPPSASDADRLAYYAGRVSELEEELLRIKAEYFAAKTVYEDRIAELETGKTEETPPESEFTYTVSAEGVTLTAYTGRSINVQIPASIDGRAVVSIGDKTFLGNATVQSVVVPEGVRSLGWFAFSGCVSLGAVSLPASVETISYGAFENCSQSLTVFCPKGSYAERYAQSYGIATAS